MSAEQWFWGLAIVAGLSVIGWLAMEACTAPTEVESAPLGDLLGGQTTYPESLVLHSGDDGAGQLCFDCGADAQMHMPWAISDDGQPIEAALCFGCALVETSTGEEADQ